MTDTCKVPVTDRYLRTRDVADRFGVTGKTLSNAVAAGLFREGEHFFDIPKLGRRWKWEAVVQSVEAVRSGSKEPVFRLAEPGGNRPV